MAQATTQKNNNQSKSNEKSGSSSNPNIPIISFVLKLICKVIGVCLFAGMILLLLEIVLFFIVDNPLNASYERYKGVSDFAKTGSWFNEKSFIQHIEHYLTELLNIHEAIAYVETYINLALSKISAPGSHRSDMANFMLGITRSVLTSTPDLLRLWVIVTFTWCAKVLTVIAMLLPCLIIIVGGFIDGTVERKINTYKGKRDSQDKIEWWFLAFKTSSYTVLFLYMAIPNELQATLVMLPSACVTAFFIRQVAASYKKYW